MARPFRLFSVYDFFSVFIPGLATLLSFYLLLPKPITIGIIAAVIPILVLSFVFGQALHALSALFESKFSNWTRIMSHRDHFGHKLANPDEGEQRVINRFKKECGFMLGDTEIMKQTDELTKDEWKRLYPIIQSHVYQTQSGRSQTFQAIYAFSRSMLILLTGLPILYLIHYFFRTIIPRIDRDPKYLLYFPSFWDFIEVAIPLCILGALLFAYSSYSYKRYFVQYLVADYILEREKI
jgi:hypothetical protein